MIAVTFIKLLHLAIIVGVLISVFIPHCFVKEIALTLLIFLLFQYLSGYETCGLTKLEYIILGQKHYQEGFIYRLVKPVITIPEKYFNSGLLYAHIIWIIILGYQVYKAGCVPTIIR